MESANPNSDTPKPCSGNCGFFGSAPLNYYCSVCFKKVHGEEEFKRRTCPPANEKAAAETETKTEPMVVEQTTQEEPAVSETKPSEPVPSDEEPKKPVSTRCFSCNKKVGLTGFTCRCGNTFCGTHRYSDKHDCTFDYKTAGREQLATANPVVEAAKMEKI